MILKKTADGVDHQTAHTGLEADAALDENRRSPGELEPGAMTECEMEVRSRYAAPGSSGRGSMKAGRQGWAALERETGS